MMKQCIRCLFLKNTYVKQFGVENQFVRPDPTAAGSELIFPAPFRVGVNRENQFAVWVRMRTIILFYLVILFGLNSCIQDVNVNFNDKDQTYVLNGILRASQDTVTVWLTKSRPLASDTAFEVVENAQITLLENDQKVGDFTRSDSSAYLLNYHPQALKTYRVEARIGNRLVWAETTVPSTPVANIQVAKSGYVYFYQIQLSDPADETNYYWVSASGYEGSREAPTKNITCSVFSSFVYADDFNQSNADIGIYGLEYEYYMRFSDHEIQGKTVDVNFEPACIGYPKTVFILSADSNLDKYMKSSLLQKQREDFSGEMPVAYSPFPIYSNIHGGTGIFGSVNSASKVFTYNNHE